MYEVAIWQFIESRYIPVTAPLPEAEALAERKRRLADMEARSGVVPDMTRVILALPITPPKPLSPLTR